MLKNGFVLILFIQLFSVASFSQTDEIWLDSGFQEKDTNTAHNYYSPSEVILKIRSLPMEPTNITMGGYVSSIFHEGIDSACIEIKIDGKKIGVFYSEQGLYSLAVEKKNIGKVLDISIIHPDFHRRDTSMVLPPEGPVILFSQLAPHYKILLRARVFAGNLPLEGVHVQINHNGKITKLETRGCFYDNEDYWNCLFNGMFKIDLRTDNPSDSIFLTLQKEGMKSFTKAMRFDEYSGEIMNLRMRYDDILPKTPINNLNLKLAFPITSTNNDWHIGLSYYRLLNSTALKRIALGLDANLYVSNIATQHNTFTDKITASKDSSYVDGFVGPSALFWILQPQRRAFSTYAGCTYAKRLGHPEMTLQTMLGSRYFLDFNKAISMELRYTWYEIDVAHYTFYSYKNATIKTRPELFRKIHINIGIQIVF